VGLLSTALIRDSVDATQCQRLPQTTTTAYDKGGPTSVARLLAVISDRLCACVLAFWGPTSSINRGKAVNFSKLGPNVRSGGPGWLSIGPTWPKPARTAWAEQADLTERSGSRTARRCPTGQALRQTEQVWVPAQTRPRLDQADRTASQLDEQLAWSSCLAASKFPKGGFPRDQKSRGPKVSRGSEGAPGGSQGVSRGPPESPRFPRRHHRERNPGGD